MPYQAEYDPNAMEVPFFSGPTNMFVRQPVSTPSFNVTLVDSMIRTIQLNYHMYTPAIPSAFVSSSTDSHFTPPSSTLHELLRSRSETIRGTPPTGTYSNYRPLPTF
jgi:PAB-dependent poly(A)-specific ribonuclease subunit 3